MTPRQQFEAAYKKIKQSKPCGCAERGAIACLEDQAHSGFIGGKELEAMDDRWCQCACHDGQDKYAKARP